MTAPAPLPPPAPEAPIPHTACYDRFRLAEGKVVEHWDTIEAIPPPSAWKNENGQF